MNSATVVLALRISLDVAAARRLADYGVLEDAGVARALEQVQMQRWGRDDAPGHLRCIDGLAAIVAVDDRLTRVHISERADEKARLVALFGAWPSGAVDLVDWDGTASHWLCARAIAHDLSWPKGLAKATPRALAEWVAPAPADHPVPAEEIEQESLRLIGGLGSPAAFDLVGARAAARYRVWLRWQYCSGRISEDTRRLYEAQLVELVGQSAGQTGGQA